MIVHRVSTGHHSTSTRPTHVEAISRGIPPLLMRRRLSGLLIGWFLAGAASASPAEIEPGAVALPAAVRLSTPSERRERELSPAWRAFQSRNGRWTAEWNEITGTPHRAIGPPIALPGYVGRAACRGGVE